MIKQSEQYITGLFNKQNSDLFNIEIIRMLSEVYKSKQNREIQKEIIRGQTLTDAIKNKIITIENISDEVKETITQETIKEIQ